MKTSASRTTPPRKAGSWGARSRISRTSSVSSRQKWARIAPSQPQGASRNSVSICRMSRSMRRRRAAPRLEPRRRGQELQTERARQRGIERHGPAFQRARIEQVVRHARRNEVDIPGTQLHLLQVPAPAPPRRHQQQHEEGRDRGPGWRLNVRAGNAPDEQGHALGANGLQREDPRWGWNRFGAHAARLPRMKCPECKKPMAERSFGAKSGGRVQLDVCQGCGGLWFDTNESLQLSAGGTLLLFRAVYGEREAYHPRRDGPMSCPRCDEKLVLVHDLAHSNRFQSWRCGQGHGHFITFFQFLREKGLVRALHPKELTELRKHVDTLLCSDCGEPIRLANRSSCARCHAPLSLMDPECVETTIRDA